MLRKLINKVVSSVRGGAEPGGENSKEVREEIRALEQQLQSATSQRRPQLLNRLGDLYLKSGAHSQALRVYGRGIDMYLENGYYDAAAALCRKVIEVSPNVVRARCTLAFLSFGKEMVADAERELADYVRAAREAEQEEFLIRRLQMMAETTDNPEILRLLREHLLELGEVEIADRILASPGANRAPQTAVPHEDQLERWGRALRMYIIDSGRDIA